MKNMQLIIEQTAQQLGLKESVVENIIRSAEEDTRLFVSTKAGYSIWWPSLGTMKFNVKNIIPYVQSQQRTLAYWTYRLQVGYITNNGRTITAAQENIKLYNTRIENALLIKQEYINKHSTYDKAIDSFIQKTADTDISRLEELLDVSDIVAQFEEKYKGKESSLPEVPIKNPLRVIGNN